MSAKSTNAVAVKKETLHDVRHDRAFFGHPKGIGVLSVLNFSNSAAWGAFYAIAVVYLYSPWIKGLGFSHGDASSLIAVLGACNSIFLIVGSWFADRVLGMRKALIIGNLIKATGFFLFAIPTPTVGLGRILAILGIVCLSLPVQGASAASLAGQMYDKKDVTRRDSAFTIFNIVNTIAGLIIPIVAAQIGLLNYHIGFAIAGVFALLCTLAIFVTQYKYFGPLGEQPINPLNDSEKKKFTKIAIMTVAIAAVVIAIVIALHLASFQTIISTISGAAFLIPIVFIVSLFNKKKLAKSDRRHIIDFVCFFLGQIMYYLATTLLMTTVFILIDAKVQNKFLGLTVAPGSVQVVYMAFSIMISFLFIYLWNRTKLGQVRTTTKFSIGMFSYFIAYMILTLPLFILNTSGRMSIFLVFAFYLFVAICDQHMGPVGMSVVSQLAPEGEDTQMQTAWGQGAAIGNGIAMVLFMIFQTTNQQMYLFPIMAVAFLILFIVFFLSRGKIE